VLRFSKRNKTQQRNIERNGDGMTPAQFLTAVDRVSAAPVHRKPTMVSAALTIGVELAGQRDDLAARLERQWSWLQSVCADHRQCAAEHDQTFHDREAKFIETLGAYEAACDALTAGRKALASC
jgi:hypothetical protein